MQIIGLLVLGFLAFGLIYAFVIRPWHLNMGSTKDEVQRSLPGDELVAEPKFVWNQAITINAPAAEVWPWLVQIGKPKVDNLEITRSFLKKKILRLEVSMTDPLCVQVLNSLKDLREEF